MFDVARATRKAEKQRVEKGRVSYEHASPSNETWFDRAMGWATETKSKIAKTRSEAKQKVKQKIESFASEKLSIPAYKLHLPTKLKQNTAGFGRETATLSKWWGGAELKALASYSAVNIFGQLDIWGKEFNKAVWGGLNSLPMSSGKSHTGEKMLDALLAAQASRTNAGSFRI